MFRRKKVPTFILGCQRSGTTICVNIFRQSRKFEVHGEASKAVMNEIWRLRPLDDVSSVIDQSRKRFLIMKPINDSHRADELLAGIEGAKVVWIYRNLFDTVNSAVVKWKDRQGRMLRHNATAIRQYGNLEKASAALMEWPKAANYSERLDEQTCEQLLRWTDGDLSNQTAAAIIWYLRNRFFFELDLDKDERVLLVKYEDFVTSPEAEVRRICQFIGSPYSSKLSAGINASSIGKASVPEIDADVLQSCQELADRLDATRESVA